MKLYLMIICLITCLNMQGMHAELINFLGTNGNVAVMPTTDVKESVKFFADKFPFINIVSVKNPDDLSQENFNNCLNSVTKQPTLILYPSSIIEGSNICMRHVNKKTGFNAQVFGLHNPTTQSTINVTQFPIFTPQKTPKSTYAASSGIIACIQNLYSEWISPYSHHIALGTLLGIIAYLYGKKS